MRKKLIYAIACLLAATTALATPVEFDTEDAHVIVVRPIDLWSGDLSSAEDMLDAYKSKKVSYVIEKQDSGVYIGYPQLFMDVTDHPITKGAEKKLAELNFKPVSNQLHNFKVEKSIPIDVAEFPALIQYQQAIFKYVVLSQGDPATLPSRVKGKKFLGGLLSLGAIAVSANTFGLSTGTNFAVNSGIADDVYRRVSQYRGSIAPINLPNVDLKDYQAIDIRKITTSQNDRVGQVIIAYKNAKTPEAEQTALIRAIVTLAGADTTLRDIEQSRAENYAERVAIWNACVGDDACKSEGINESGIKARLQKKRETQ